MDKMSAVQAAVDQLQALLAESDGKEMMAARQPAMGGGMDAGPEAMPAKCAECEAGTCTDPEHMTDEDMSAMEG